MAVRAIKFAFSTNKHLVIEGQLPFETTQELQAGSTLLMQLHNVMQAHVPAGNLDYDFKVLDGVDTLQDPPADQPQAQQAAQSNGGAA